MEELVAFLSTIYPLTDACKEYLRNAIKHRHLRKGEYILRPGQIDRYMSFIEKGLLRAFYLKKNGKEVTAWFMQLGDVITDVSSFYDQVPSSKYIQVVEDTDLYHITFSELEYLYDNFIEFNRVGRVLITNYFKLWDKMREATIMQSARERYEWLQKHDPDLILKVHAKYIASFLGITEVTLSKLKHKLAHRKTVVAEERSLRST